MIRHIAGVLSSTIIPSALTHSFSSLVCQRCSVCCLRTCWCSYRSKTTSWSSNARARATPPFRRASRCWALLSSWIRSFSVTWPQVSHTPQYKLYRSLAFWNQCHSLFLFFLPFLLDQKAFYVIFTWDSGAQIYELVAQSIGERKMWVSKRNTWTNYVCFRN